MQKIVWLKEIYEEETHLIIVQENEHDSHSTFMSAMSIAKQEGLENPVAEIFSSALKIESDNILPDPIPLCWLMYETRNDLNERCFILRMTGEPQQAHVLLEIYSWLLPAMENIGVNIITCLSYAGNTNLMEAGDLYVYDWATEERSGVLMTTNAGLITQSIPIDGFAWVVPFLAKRIMIDLEAMFTISIKTDTLIDERAATTLCRFLNDTHDLDFDQTIIKELGALLNKQYKSDGPFLGDMFNEDF